MFNSLSFRSYFLLIMKRGILFDKISALLHQRFGNLMINQVEDWYESVDFLKDNPATLVVLDEGLSNVPTEFFLHFLDDKLEVVPPVLVLCEKNNPEQALSLIRAGAFEAIHYEGNDKLLTQIAKISKECIQASIAKEQNRYLHELHHAILETAGEGIIGLNVNGDIIFANNSAEQLLKAEEGGLIGLSINSILLSLKNAETEISEEEQQEISVEHPFSLAYINDGKFHHEDDAIICIDGSQFAAEYTVTLLRDEVGKLSGCVLVFSDISIRKQHQERLSYLSHYDQLTGLANRTLFNDRIENVLEVCKRKSNYCAVLLLDMDRFKWVNDTLGHDVGDGLLKAMGERLKETARTTDTVARLGGDEFAILMTDLKHRQDASILAHNILLKFRRPFQVGSHELNITGSVGIATYPDCGEDVSSLLKAADIAMYRAKNEGRNSFHFYSKQIHEEVVRSNELQSELRRAIRADEFILAYQSIHDTYSGDVVGAEALLRWNHPKKGELGPLTFIDIAEESSLIIPLGELVLKKAFMQVKEWRDQGVLDFSQFTLAVNISPKQLRNDYLVGLLEDLIAETGVPGDVFKLEVTEHVMAADLEECTSILREIRELGVRVSIDDFGTGYCSLKYLQSFPINTLKIDRCFISNAVNGRGDAAIVKATVAIAKAFGIDVVAEGVETKEQYELVKGFGCDSVQGYFFSMPISAERFIRKIRERATQKALQQQT